MMFTMLVSGLQRISQSVAATSTFQKRMVEWVEAKTSVIEKELKTHASESAKQIKYYLHQYEVDWYLGPTVDSLLTESTPPLLRFTLQTFLAHPQIVYFNKLYDAGTFTKIYERKLSPYDFIKSECKNLTDAETLKKVISTLITGLKFAIIGPLLAYFTACAFSEIFGVFTNTIVTNILKTIMACIFFQSRKDFSIFCTLLPTMFLAGSFRGFIFYHASIFFKTLNFNSKDIFYFSMIIRQIFEPQVKKIEKLDASQFLAHNETISRIISTIATNLKLVFRGDLLLYFMGFVSWGILHEIINTSLKISPALGDNSLYWTNSSFMVNDSSSSNSINLYNSTQI